MIAAACGVGLSACGGGGSGSTLLNRPPTAQAGAAQSVGAGAVVTLDGTGRSDADGDALVYSLTLAAKPIASAAVISSSPAARPTFLVDGRR